MNGQSPLTDPQVEIDSSLDLFEFLSRRVVEGKSISKMEGVGLIEELWDEEEFLNSVYFKENAALTL